MPRLPSTRRPPPRLDKNTSPKFRQKLLPLSYQFSRFVMQPVEFQVFAVVLKHWPSLADGYFRPDYCFVMKNASRPALYNSALLTLPYSG
ncbi:hypothetical protein K7459_13305 [Pseudomonas fluorescens]|uniref:Uncharacterized protein n=1 Tax=Pseudomonas fluorescens (strain Pf0-1) TaxID=205922 RepID=Q3KAR8_PSEPF|nr:hypothetical protein Pfl01_3398 [Pseudomonas fluorescens Pf0-1]MBX8620864.1 hypothetical protein [Pseudomonas glycinae]MBY9024644.1 hypothetical protein [Pseudomonas fluorescens]MBY9030841.1 hypothetical protein [Pseudomonas fluorescens]MBY9036844.1 hypothetical protein [Pseudomonas fluorescens]